MNIYSKLAHKEKTKPGLGKHLAVKLGEGPMYVLKVEALILGSGHGGLADIIAQASQDCPPVQVMPDGKAYRLRQQTQVLDGYEIREISHSEHKKLVSYAKAVESAENWYKAQGLV